MTYDQAQNEILRCLKDLVSEKIGVDPELLIPGAVLADIGIDSYSLIELVFSVEEELSIRIPMDGVAVTTVDDVVSVIQKALATRASSTLRQA